MTERPSIILFITDQQQAGMLGCAGDPLVRTPNIDQIARQGIRFDNFHVAMPSCMPNRASIMTGRYPSVNGVRFNGIPLPQGSVTFPELFRQGGYRTALMGKGHLQPILDPYNELGKCEERWWRSELTDRGAELSPPYYGYDEVSIVTGHGDHCGGHYEKWLEAQLPGYKQYLGAENQLPHNYSCPQAVRTRLPEELYSTSYIADRAIDFLERHAASANNEPFLLVVSFPDPHHPFNPPGRYWDMYDPDDVTLPENFDAPDDDVPHLAAARRARRAHRDNRGGYGAVALDEREAREASALTYGMITMIDDAIGQVRTRLSELGYEDRAIQIFTSDHGDLLGDHGLMLKGPLHYGSLVRVPFILSDPARSDHGTLNDALFSSLDIGTSLLSRVGLADLPGSQGISIFDVLDNRRERRENLMIEDEYQSPVLEFDTPPVVRTLRTQKWRMTLFDNCDWGELYDLERDPHECRNLWDEPAIVATKVQLLAELSRSMMQSVDRKLPPVSLA
ncbi:MAG: sulfatase-like hydrolase/transferase [Nitratireductor sp.]|nr:sulfatase-like hydrolase/transferase [Nitratireductor sp.]MCC0022294.1 sulfatase-like hydrolase/transferase [Nitratireductor sp.]